MRQTHDVHLIRRAGRCYFRLPSGLLRRYPPGTELVAVRGPHATVFYLTPRQYAGYMKDLVRTYDRVWSSSSRKAADHLLRATVHSQRDFVVSRRGSVEVPVVHGSPFAKGTPAARLVVRPDKMVLWGREVYEEVVHSPDRAAGRCLAAGA